MLRVRGCRREALQDVTAKAAALLFSRAAPGHRHQRRRRVDRCPPLRAAWGSQHGETTYRTTGPVTGGVHQLTGPDVTAWTKEKLRRPGCRGRGRTVGGPTLRIRAGRTPTDRLLSDLVGELATGSDAFASPWARHNVRLHRTARKRLHKRDCRRPDLPRGRASAARRRRHPHRRHGADRQRGPGRCRRA